MKKRENSCGGSGLLHYMIKYDIPTIKYYGQIQKLNMTWVVVINNNK